MQTPSMPEAATPTFLDSIGEAVNSALTPSVKWRSFYALLTGVRFGMNLAFLYRYLSTVKTKKQLAKIDSINVPALISNPKLLVNTCSYMYRTCLRTLLKEIGATDISVRRYSYYVVVKFRCELLGKALTVQRLMNTLAEEFPIELSAKLDKKYHTLLEQLGDTIKTSYFTSIRSCATNGKILAVGILHEIPQCEGGEDYFAVASPLRVRRSVCYRANGTSLNGVMSLRFNLVPHGDTLHRDTLHRDTLHHCLQLIQDFANFQKLVAALKLFGNLECFIEAIRYIEEVISQGEESDLRFSKRIKCS